jgi:hypothetical protein
MSFVSPSFTVVCCYILNFTIKIMTMSVDKLANRQFILWAIREGKYQITCFNVGPTEEVRFGIPVEPKQESSGEDISYQRVTMPLINPYSDIKGDDVHQLQFHLHFRHC